MADDSGGTVASTWLTILGMALATFAVRALPLLALRRPPSPAFERALRHVAPAMFAALLVPPLLAPTGTLAAGPELVAGVAGAAVARSTRNVPATIAAGFAVYWALRMSLP
jgi:branched-subunit amino acid transport protein